MSAINELREDLARTETAQFVTTMLRDISATRLQSIKAVYEANEKYFIELHGLMHLLKTYATEKNIVLPSSENKRVLVAVTSNRRFYGTLNVDVINSLRKELQADPTSDCVVIGQTGKQILERNPVGSSVIYTAFKKDEPTTDEVGAIVAQLADYDEVAIVHPTYINAFQQNALITDLTHVPKMEVDKHEGSVEYLFEPDVPAMLEFFKMQIRLVLFDRVVLETRLALTGARLMKMQRARERTEEMLVEERRIIHKEISTMQSMRLLETFAGFRNENAL